MLRKILVTLISISPLALQANDELSSKTNELERAIETENENRLINSQVNGFLDTATIANTRLNSELQNISTMLKEARISLNADSKKLSSIRNYVKKSFEGLSSKEPTDPTIIRLAEDVAREYQPYVEKCNSLQYPEKYMKIEDAISTLEFEGSNINSEVDRLLTIERLDIYYVNAAKKFRDSFNKQVASVKSEFSKIPSFIDYPPICSDLLRVPDILETVKSYAVAIQQTDASNLKELRAGIGSMIDSLRSRQKTINVLDEFNVLVTSMEVRATNATRRGSLHEISNIESSINATRRLIEFGTSNLNLGSDGEKLYLSVLGRLEKSNRSLATFKSDLSAIKISLYRRIKDVSRSIRKALRKGPVNLDSKVLSSIGVDSKSGKIVKSVEPKSFEHALEIDRAIVEAEKLIRGL